MSRNYVSELQSKGYSLRRLAKETGISKSTLHRISQKVMPPSSTASYEKIRNANRRLAYQELREAGVKPEASRQYRRQFTAPPEVQKVRFRSSKRYVKAKFDTTRYQLRLVADYEETKTGQVAYAVESYSMAHLEVVIEEMIEEAINEARRHLGGTNWELIRIIEQGIMEYILSPGGTEKKSGGLDIREVLKNAIG